MNGNIRAYNAGLAQDTSEAGFDLGSLVGLAASSGLARDAVAQLDVERPAGAACNPFDAACARYQSLVRAQSASGWADVQGAAGAAAPELGVAQDVALHAALYSGNGAAAVGALGAAGAATQVFSSYSALTSTQREQPICAGIDDGATLFACLENDGVVPEEPSLEGFVLNDLSTLGLLTYAGGADLAAQRLADAAGEGLEQAALAQLLQTGEVSGGYLAVNRGLNAADRGQALVGEKTAQRPW